MRDLRGGFQFTHPCGCDGQAVRNIPIPVRFNSRTRVGATARKAFNVPDAEVSIHAPVWVRLPLDSFGFFWPCFNSRTRVGATARKAFNVDDDAVSIHAPVWVRPFTRGRAFSLTLFQFTHPCGCDLTPAECETYEAGFNSRTRVGATKRKENIMNNKMVSIHAPVWVRQTLEKLSHGRCMFQFTHPCGCDRVKKDLRSAYSCFNSRTRVGATLHDCVDVSRRMFQFTHPCGCDKC